MRKKVANIVTDRERYDEVSNWKKCYQKNERKHRACAGGYKEGQSLPDFVHTYSEETQSLQIKNLCDKATELKSQTYSTEQKVPRIIIDEIHQTQPNHSIESIKRAVTKSLPKDFLLKIICKKYFK